MAEPFLQLEAEEQARIYQTLAPLLARSPAVLEKDVWVCWVLQSLFNMPGQLPMAFKGGTSLSKVFGVIARFSEDVDITLDYRGLGSSLNPFDEGLSRTRLARFSDALKAFVRNHVHSVVAPHLQLSLATQFSADTFKLHLSEDGEQLRLHYPTVLEAAGDYVGSSVLIEFGGRNITEPSEDHRIMPDIASHIAALEFPCATVRVLSPARTFWEKATLMHVACQRKEFQAGSERLSRHWYDLAMLAEHAQGQKALADKALLADVIRHKKVFFNASYARYEACLEGLFRLVPDEPVLAALRDDYQRMIDAGMFSAKPPAFDVIVERLHALQTQINHTSPTL